MNKDVIITNIFWKRTYLFVEYMSKKNIKLSIVKTKTDKKNPEKIEVIKKHDLETKKLDTNKYRSKINITIAEGKNLLESGKWIFIIDDDITNTPSLSDEILLNIDNFCKCFPYSKNFYTYNVNFLLDKKVDIDNLAETYSLSLYTEYYKKNFKPFKRQWYEVRDAKDFKSFIKMVSIRLAKKCLNAYYQIVTHITPKTGKRVLFMSENRTKLMDNLAAINKRMLERGLDKEFRISYHFRNIFDKTKKQNPFSWLRTITLIAKQDYIFVDDYVPIFAFLKLSKKTTLTQVWHAGFGFKLVGFARFGIDGSPHPVESCHRKYTYGLIGNNNLKEIYSEVWGIPKENLLATGMPRLEHFLDEDVIKKAKEEIYKEYPEIKEKKVITFAPTYRGSSQSNAYYDYKKLDFDRICKYCEENNAIFIFSQHHFLTDEIPIKDEQKKYLYNFSGKPLNNTFYITDVLITDYSSCFYDYLLLQKPVIFYTYDKNLYSATRGVHRPIDKVAPGPICSDFNELMKALEDTNKKETDVKDFLIDKCLTNRTLASDQVINYILLHKDVEGL